MLTDIVHSGLAVCVGPEPALAAVESCTSLCAPRGVPEGDRDIITVDPFPILGILGVSHGAHPVLTAAITSAQE